MVKVLYAPSKREFSDDLHNNIACSFEVMVLETLLENNDLEVFFYHMLKDPRKF
ncbi:MAG: hypothetical protein SPE20_02480 [Helicobacter sp.]|uniref:hypothetical protein n=1 Tax=Helicobacter sp. TaxID=218 RepID=UPI002A7FE687|nr:hypothetical protein [Helicobacter sp.]MDY4426217.1 hypothetical protein [Helicobacter sp.]